MEFSSEAIRAVSTGFQALFLAGMGRAISLYTLYCMPLESTGDRETFQIPEGIGELEEWVGPLKIDTPIQWTQTIRNKDWSKTLGVPVNAYKDDNLGVYKQQAELLGIAAANHPDKLLFDTIVGGFTAESYDGVAFFSASHPMDGGGTQSNLVSGALSATKFREALTALDGMTDYYGKPLNLRGMGVKYTLMVGPSNRATANSIVKLATTASGAGNPDFEEAEVVVNPYFIGARAAYWVLLAGGGPVYPFILQMREKPEVIVNDDPKSDDVLKNKRVLHHVQGRWNMGYGFWQLAVGATGA